MTAIKDTLSPRLFHYHIEYYDEQTDEIDEDTGLTIGFDYSSAMGHIEDYYGIDNITRIEMFETQLLLEAEDIKKVFKD